MLADTRELFRKYTCPQDFEKIKECPTVSQMWERCAEEYADKTAIEFDGNAYSYAQLDSDAAQMRALIDSALGGKPARVGLLSSNSYGFVKAYLAIVTLGCTAVILPPHLDEKSVYGCCLKYGVEALVYQSELEDKVKLAGGALGEDKLLKTSQTSQTSLALRRCNPGDGCVMMFTGGTTGKSKCALLSNDAVMQGTVNGCYGIEKVFGLRYLLVLPLTHVFGLIRNLMTSLYTGSTLFICRNNKDMFRDIAVFKPNILVLVPALAEMALSLSKQFGRNMLGEDMKYIICGAAAVSPYLIAEYDKLGINLLQGYGLTESANLVSGNPESLKYPDSIGYPYPNQELKIVDGELWLKGRNMMDGYVGGDEELSFEDGWFKTGDLVRIDDDGRLYITGRIKEIIVLSNGENISPAEVENHFNTLPFIQDSQVFEDVDERGNHFLSLEVVPRTAVLLKEKPVNPEEYIISELRKINRTLPPYMQVNKITVRDSDFERTPSMKIVRYKKCK